MVSRCLCCTMAAVFVSPTLHTGGVGLVRSSVPNSAFSSEVTGERARPDARVSGVYVGRGGRVAFWKALGPGCPCLRPEEVILKSDNNAFPTQLSAR